jgi:hypothetical protein
VPRALSLRRSRHVVRNRAFLSESALLLIPAGLHMDGIGIAINRLEFGSTTRRQQAAATAGTGGRPGFTSS